MDPKTGLYSKAAKIIRGLPQERGTASELVAAARNKFGLKEAELKNAGPLPEGPITREELAQIFEQSLPKLRIDQYGENPNYLSRDENQRRIALQNRSYRGEELTPEERAEADRLQRRVASSPNVEMREDEDTGDEEPVDTEYGDYVLKGGKNYRERLLKLDRPKDPRQPYEDALRKAEVMASAWPEGHRKRQQFEEQAEEYRKALAAMPPRTQPPVYQSSHWAGHPNVLAHIRLSDRTVGEDRDSLRPVAEKLAAHLGVGVRDMGSGAADAGVKAGVITPEEAASLSRVMGWGSSPYYGQKGVGKRLLHVEELQSDWGQEGRDKGFRTKPFRVWDKKTGQTVSEHDTNDAAWEAYMAHPDRKNLDYGHNHTPPPAPYVTNTQHWTDLALKNVLREAALGNYDGIVFTPGQAQADRYGLEKQLDALHYEPETQSLYGEQNGRKVVEKSGVKPEELGSYVGKDAAEKLMNPENHYQYGNTIRSTLTGGDLKMGGRGMVKYYDEMVPKSALKLAKMHDLDIQPAEPISMKGDDGNEYQGFHLPMTENLKNSILSEGFPAFRRGGSVDSALSATRRFTKDGAGAMMRLKP